MNKRDRTKILRIALPLKWGPRLFPEGDRRGYCLEGV